MQETLDAGIRRTVGTAQSLIGWNADVPSIDAGLITGGRKKSQAAKVAGGVLTASQVPTGPTRC
jgi:hypothetical protein